MRRPKLTQASLVLVVLAAFAHTPQASAAQAAAPPASHAARYADSARSANARTEELRAARAYEAALHTGPLAVQAFLADFPKGADLHMHLGAGVYAETMLHFAGIDKLCIDVVQAKFARNEQGAVIKEPCPTPLVPASELSGNLTQEQQDLYDRMIDSFSMRNFVPSSGVSGHDQFFATFDRFSGLDHHHTGDWVDDVTRRAAAQNQQYLEVMHTPSFGHAAGLAHQLGFNPDLAKFRQALLDGGLRQEIATDREEIRQAVELRNRLQHCGTSEAIPACKVQVRFIYQVLRAFSPEQVFAQTLLGFETVEQAIEQHSDDWVGLDFVQPEDYMVAMRDYSLHMHMIEYLHSLYPKVHIDLHAGELAPGMVPPDGLRFHIREAVEVGHAERIGHGVDVMYEENAPELLKEMARKHIMVEINLTSNDGILGTKGDQHPFKSYLAAHVPVSLSTDDQGVSRIDLTHEYVRAANEYRLTYAELKQLARTGMEHNFLPGDSLWASPDAFGLVTSACRSSSLGSDHPSSACQAFLAQSEKAAAQWELEHRFRIFEAKF